MNARQQPALAPFLRIGAGCEAPPHRKTLGLQRYQRCADCRGIEPQSRREVRLRDRPQPFEPATQNLDQCVLGQPLPLQPRRRGNRRLEPGLREQRLELRQPLGSDPELSPVRQAHQRGALLSCELGQPVSPALAARDLLLAEEAEPDQRVVQLIGVGGRGPSLSADARNGFGIEPAEIGGGLAIEPAAAHDGLGAALLKGRIVEKGIGPRREDLKRQRRRLGQIAADDADRA